MTPTTLAVAAVDALARFAALALTTARVVLAVADAVAHPALGLVMTFAASVLVASTLGGDRAPPFVLVLLLVYALGGGWRACASAEELAMMRARGHRTPKAMRAATRAIARALGADGASETTTRWTAAASPRRRDGRSDARCDGSGCE